MCSKPGLHCKRRPLVVRKMSTEDAFSQIFFHTRTIYQVIISHIQNPSLAQKHIKKECG